ncbi:MAG: pirin family protein [Acidimicrobiia bacterium]|nr:pirin family protein [Acidimicrobiia bacterium]
MLEVNLDKRGKEPVTAFPLGPQWPTIDPFLFVAHHLDHYPSGTDRLGPAASLDGRAIGNDFAGVDGWNMYHGSVVPGFPQHPHRGFETVTYLRTGVIDHSDSLGATARYGPGDTQWLTAGAGIVHSEMFPLLSTDHDNPLELFQIWLNLPRSNKMVDPHFTMLWSEATPRVPVGSPAADGSESAATLIAGSLDGHRAQDPPPDSWAGNPDADVAIVHLELHPGSTWTLPRVSDGVARVAYFYRGSKLAVGDSSAGGENGGRSVVEGGHGLQIGTGPVSFTAEGETALVMILQGRPIGEPVAQYGPFVLNDRAGIEQAFADYQRTGFGGWPWERDDPVHDRDAGRFALRPDGGRETPEPITVP